MSLDLMVRSFALGCAVGSRTSLLLAAPVLFGAPAPPAAGRSGHDTTGNATTNMAAGPPFLAISHTPARSSRAHKGAVVALAVELLGDKLPFARSRLEPPGPVVRVTAGALGAVRVARRLAGKPTVALVAVGALGGAFGTWGGAAWRRLAVGRGPDFPLAVAEDVLALTLAAYAFRPDDQHRSDAARLAPPETYN